MLLSDKKSLADKEIITDKGIVDQRKRGKPTTKWLTDNRRKQCHGVISCCARAFVSFLTFLFCCLGTAV